MLVPQLGRIDGERLVGSQHAEVGVVTHGEPTLPAQADQVRRAFAIQRTTSTRIVSRRLASLHTAGSPS